MNNVQTTWIEIAEELENKKRSSSGKADYNILNEMIKENKDKFIQLVFSSQRTQLTQKQFNIGSMDDPEKELHDKLFNLATAFFSLQPSTEVNQTLINKLVDSLMGCFAL